MLSEPLSVETIARALLGGLPLTVGVTLVGGVITTIAAFVAGLARLSRRRLIRWIATIYVELFRGMSAYVWLFLAYFVLPRLLIQLNPFWAGSVTVGLVGGAYCAEIVRGAVQAVPRGQTEAATALNFTPTRRMTAVILPQAIVAMIPPMTNMYVAGVKGTALVSLIGLEEMVSRAQSLRGISLTSNIPIFSQLLLYYLVLALLIVGATRLLENVLKRRWGLSVSHKALVPSEGAVM